MSRFVFYSKDGCPFCSLLKLELTKRGHSFEVVNLTDDAERKRFYTNTGHNSVPQLYERDTNDTYLSPAGYGYGGYLEVSSDWDKLSIDAIRPLTG